MKSQWMATAFALVLAGPALAGDDDRAVPRGGSSGGSSSVGSSHHSGGSGSASGSSSSHSGSSSGSSSSYTAPPQNDAQRRHPRAGTGTGGRYYSNGGYYYSPYYSPYYYNPYYWNWGLGFGFGYPAYYPGYYGYGYAPSGYGYAPSRVGSVRVMVEPAQTRVYVDGYYAGMADDFDGLFQRLNVASGRHEIALKLDGHRTFKVKVYVPLDQTVKLRHRMEPGTGEEISPDAIGQPDDYAREDEGRGRDEPEGGEDPDYGEPVAGEEGSLRLLVNPDDASVYVDGDFRGTVRQIRRLRLSPGRHRVELVRPGFRTFEREVDVRPGRESDLQIDLDRN